MTTLSQLPKCDEIGRAPAATETMAATTALVDQSFEQLDAGILASPLSMPSLACNRSARRRKTISALETAEWFVLPGGALHCNSECLRRPAPR